MRIVLASCVARMSKAKSGPAFRSGCARSFALLWLTVRKRPGKFCRREAVLPSWRTGPAAGSARLAEQNQQLVAMEEHGTALAWSMRDHRHGSGAGPIVKTSAGSRGCQASLRQE